MTTHGEFMRSSITAVALGVAALRAGCSLQPVYQRPAAPLPASFPTGSVYDPIDSFYLPIWGFSGIQRPGPSIVITQNCSP